MKIYSWEGIPPEALNENLWRKVIHGSKMTMAQIHFDKGAAVPSHHHENEQFSLVVSGAVRFELEGKEVVPKPGEIIHIPSNVPHRVVALEESIVMDIFSPIRQDWIDGTDDYFRKK